MVGCDKCNALINEGEFFCPMCGTVVIYDNAESVISEERKEYLLNYANKKAQGFNSLTEVIRILDRISDYKNASELLSATIKKYKDKCKKDMQIKLLIPIISAISISLISIMLLISEEFYIYQLEELIDLIPYRLFRLIVFVIMVYNAIIVYSSIKQKLNKSNYISNIVSLIIMPLCYMTEPLSSYSVYSGGAFICIILMICMIIASIIAYNRQKKEFYVFINSVQSIH